MRNVFTFAIAALMLLVLTVGCGKRKTWTDARKAREKRDIPKVPYIYNSRTKNPECVLWRNAERSDKKGVARVPNGTKCKIIGSKELDRTRGGTMYKVKAVSGETGWVPGFCIEYRKK